MHIEGLLSDQSIAALSQAISVALPNANRPSVLATCIAVAAGTTAGAKGVSGNNAAGRRVVLQTCPASGSVVMAALTLKVCSSSSSKPLPLSLALEAHH